MLLRTLFALSLCWAMPAGVMPCAAKQPAGFPDDLFDSINPPVRVHQAEQPNKEAKLGLSTASPLAGLPRQAVNRSSMPPLIHEFVQASEKSRAAERSLAAGREEEAVRLFAESLADLIGVRKSSPDFAPEVILEKIREVRLRLEKSLERQTLAETQGLPHGFGKVFRERP